MKIPHKHTVVNFSNIQSKSSSISSGLEKRTYDFGLDSAWSNPTSLRGIRVKGEERGKSHKKNLRFFGFVTSAAAFFLSA